MVTALVLAACLGQTQAGWERSKQREHEREIAMVKAELAAAEARIKKPATSQSIFANNDKKSQLRAKLHAAGAHKNLSQFLSEIESNKIEPTPVVDVFRMSVGDMGIVTRNKRVDCYETTDKGWVRKFAIHKVTAEVLQVIPPSSILVVAEDRDRGRKTFLLEGLETGNITNGEKINLGDRPFVVSGTKTYNTVAGSTNTVYVLRPIPTSILSATMEKK